MPWWDPAVDPAFDPVTDTSDRRRSPGRHGHARSASIPRGAPTPTIMFLAGLTAIVAGVFNDVDGGVHIAVTLEDDPGSTEALRGRVGTSSSTPTRSSCSATVDRGPVLTRRRVLVAGIGNIFLGDDGFGVEVAQRLVDRPMPDGVKVADFGIRGLHLAYELLDGYDTLVLVDALPMGEPPGTVALIEPELDAVGRDETALPIEAHGMSPAVVLGLMTGLGATVERVLIVGCRAARFSTRASACRLSWPRQSNRVSLRCWKSSTRSASPQERRADHAASHRLHVCARRARVSRLSGAA